MLLTSQSSLAPIEQNRTNKTNRFFLLRTHPFPEMAATLLDLFANRLTVSLSARQSSELSRLVSGAREAGGFLIGDLPTLEQILTLASERTLDGTHPFGAQICELLDVANEPFKEARANEAIVAAASIGSFICAVADLVVRFAGRDVSVQLAAAEVLCRFAAESSCELVERSGAAAILVKALRLEVEALGSHPSFLLGSLVDVLGEVASFGEGASVRRGSWASWTTTAVRRRASTSSPTAWRR